MKSLLNALVVAVIIGFLVGLICAVLGTVPHLTALATYDFVIGLVAGIVAFVNRWDFNL